MRSWGICLDLFLILQYCSTCSGSCDLTDRSSQYSKPQTFLFQEADFNSITGAWCCRTATKIKHCIVFVTLFTVSLCSSTESNFHWPWSINETKRIEDFIKDRHSFTVPVGLGNVDLCILQPCRQLETSHNSISETNTLVQHINFTQTQVLQTWHAPLNF